MLTGYFLLGGNKVFHFCHTATVGIVIFFTGAMVCGARMFRIVVMRLSMVFRDQAHHHPMMVVRRRRERHQHESGNRYREYGEFTFQR
jgi:hypothetical protein